MIPADELWQSALDQLKLTTDKPTYDRWFKDCTAAWDNHTLIVKVPSDYARDFMRLHPRIHGAIAERAGSEISLRYVTTQSVSTPGPGRVAVELVHFDPTCRGFVMLSNYAIRFWQPHLGPRPFALWVALRSFAWHSDRHGWPSIQTLADICAGGNRHLILGRAGRADGSRSRTVGAIETLAQHRILWPRTTGAGRNTRYYFRVLSHLPLLTPAQLHHMPKSLHAAHTTFLRRSEIDRETWQQLTMDSLCPNQPLMAGP